MAIVPPVLYHKLSPVLAFAVSSALALGVGCSVPPSSGMAWTEPEPGAFTTGPYLVLGEQPGTALVGMRANLPGAPVVDWWCVEAGAVDDEAPPASVHSVAAERRDDMWVASLQGLPIGDAIAYQVRSAVSTTPVRRFRVGAQPGQAFSFVAFGDTRTRDYVHRAVVEAIDRAPVDFILHTGDMVERGGVREQWDRFFQIERPILAEAPIIPSIGNHDVGARNYFRRYFMQSLWAEDARYFARDWGNLRVLAVDGGIECRDGCDQYAFANRVLADGARKDMLMVMMLHYPPYSAGEHGSQEGVQKPISELAERYGVELVVAGHDHNYERTKVINGVTYVVSGSAGAPPRAVVPRWFTANARTEPHFVRVDVEQDRMVLRAMNLDGDTFDATVITDNPPG
jgi:Icc-related predicted phosphoesterase